MPVCVKYAEVVENKRGLEQARAPLEKIAGARKSEVCHSPGHLYEYQKKGVAWKGVCKSLKRGMLGKGERVGASRTQRTVSQKSYKVNKIIIQLRSNEM